VCFVDEGLGWRWMVRVPCAVLEHLGWRRWFQSLRTDRDEVCPLTVHVILDWCRDKQGLLRDKALFAPATSSATEAGLGAKNISYVRESLADG
jgi:hypothetical protein